MKEKAIKPRVQVVWPGDTAEFMCSYSSKIQWYFEEGPLPSNAKVVSQQPMNKLVIQNAVLENAGMYYCEGEKRDRIKSQSEAKLLVVGKYSS